MKKIKNDSELVIEEMRQRYSQYRWEDETRSKYINYFFLFTIGYYGLVGYLLNDLDIMKPIFYEPTVEIAMAFLMYIYAFIGTFMLTSIISFRSIQNLEGKVIAHIKERSSFLSSLEYPSDRKVFNTRHRFYSTTPYDRCFNNYEHPLLHYKLYSLL